VPFFSKAIPTLQQQPPPFSSGKLYEKSTHKISYTHIQKTNVKIYLDEMVGWMPLRQQRYISTFSADVEITILY